MTAEHTLAQQCSAWRLEMAERLASQLSPSRFGVRALYLIGSARRGAAGPASDIDLLVLFQGTSEQRDRLMAWLEGWSLCLDEMNCRLTGLRTGGLLDVHMVTDEDVVNRTSYAVKIGSTTDPAKPLPLRPEGGPVTATGV